MAGKIWGKFEPDNLVKIVEESLPIVQKMGAKVVEMVPGRVTIKMPLAGNNNHIGMMYAGVLFTLGELPGGALCLTLFDGTKYAPLVKSMDITYKRPATTDITVTAVMSTDEAARISEELEKNGKSDFDLENQLVDADEQIVAVTHTAYQIRKFA